MSKGGAHKPTTVPIDTNQEMIALRFLSLLLGSRHVPLPGCRADSTFAQTDSLGNHFSDGLLAFLTNVRQKTVHDLQIDLLAK